jgi:hypothetical protein
MFPRNWELCLFNKSWIFSRVTKQTSPHSEAFQHLQEIGERFLKVRSLSASFVNSFLCAIGRIIVEEQGGNTSIVRRICSSTEHRIGVYFNKQYRNGFSKRNFANFLFSSVSNYTDSVCKFSLPWETSCCKNIGCSPFLVDDFLSLQARCYLWIFPNQSWNK